MSREQRFPIGASVSLDQRRTAGPAGPFVEVGTFDFADTGSVEVRNDGTAGYVVIDAVQFLRSPR